MVVVLVLFVCFCSFCLGFVQFGFNYSQSFPYIWIKEGPRTEIYENIKDECNINQISAQADGIIRSHILKLVRKNLFVNVRGYPVVCWGKISMKNTLDTTQLCYVWFWFFVFFLGQLKMIFCTRQLSPWLVMDVPALSCRCFISDAEYAVLMSNICCFWLLSNQQTNKPMRGGVGISPLFNIFRNC